MSDNFPLSAAAPTATEHSSGVGSALDPSVAEYLLASRAPNTHRAYAFDLQDFTAWGGKVPSTPDEVARYIAQRAPYLRPSTLRRRLAALASTHRDQGFEDPTKTTLISRVVQGIERKHGTAIKQAAPLLIDDLARIVEAMGQSQIELRDKAILLVGFFGALRRSEIVALNVESLTRTTDGLNIVIPRSKTDQFGQGRAVYLPSRRDALCPARALEEWLTASGIGAGRVFRAVGRASGLGERALNGRTVAAIVKARVASIGLPFERYSGHSLRAGYATSAALAGFGAHLIARQTGHRAPSSLFAYIRPEVRSLPAIGSAS